MTMNNVSRQQQNAEDYHEEGTLRQAQLAAASMSMHDEGRQNGI
jgi:hypothetical protein